MKIRTVRLLALLCLPAMVAHAQTRPPAPAKPPVTSTPPAAPAAAPTVAPPAMPALPPIPPVIPPPITVPVRPAPPAPPLHVAVDAPGTTTPLPDGLRVTFGADRPDLNPTTERALRALVHIAPTDARFNLVASATSKPDDTSAARRLSLSRGLNVRAVLINEGVAANRILLRALAAPASGDEAPDRVDIAVQPKSGG